jgi:phage terminase small subunit
MSARIPAEVHLIHGTKGEKMGTLLPESIKKRIPQSEWMDNPEAWNKQRFYNETSEYLFEVYGIGSEQERHVLTMLTDQIDTYVDCNRHIAVEGLVTSFNDGKTIGPSPYVSIRKEALKQIILLMNELGLTPKSRLAKPSTMPASTLGKLMLGPQVKR